MKRADLLRHLLLVDAALLALIGGALIGAPAEVAKVLHMQALDAQTRYIVGILGCVYLSMAPGYLNASLFPYTATPWVQIGIARGLLECALGVYFIARGYLAFQQVSLGLVVGGAVALAYIVLYPRTPEVTP